MKRLIAAVALTLAATMPTAAVESPYRAPNIVDAVVRNNIESINSGDNLTRTIRVYYLIGFAGWMDRSCDFLNNDAAGRIGKAVQEAVDTRKARPQDENYKLYTEAAVAGLEDAKTFLGEHGCATRESNAAKSTLLRLFQT